MRGAAEPGRREHRKRPRRAGGGLFAAGALIVTTAVLLAAAAPWLAPHDPTATVVARYAGPRPPGGEFLLGTDSLGRDVLSRLLFGARICLVVAVAATAITMAIGVPIGIAAGYFGGGVDAVLMRAVEVAMALPTLLLAIAVATLFEPSLGAVLVVIGIVNWTGVARAVRASALALREAEFVVAARAMGASHGRVIGRHLLPGLWPIVIALAALTTASAILIDAGLSYLGLGAPLPTPSWGRMISEAQAYLHVAPWLMLLPGGAIATLVVGFNLMGHGLVSRWEGR
jgi:peptide/nickel transport system permease protein